MEADGIHASKRFSRDEGEEKRDVKGVGSLQPWQNSSSRIIRVSRISGGKDRHSKVWTAKGLRDRRVRLSVSTAIQFYDLQDRLGYDQPSKAVDWLIKAADAAIADLPELDGAFPMPPTFLLTGRASLPERAAAVDQQISPSKSTCSSASETSKGSALSLSRCQARCRDRERTAKEKKNEQETVHHHQNLIAHSTFTELLTAGPTTELTDCGAGFCQKQMRPQLTASAADYFGHPGLLGQAHKIPQSVSSYPSMQHAGNNPHMGVGMTAYNATAAGDHQELQQFSFMQDHHVIPVAAVAPGIDYDLNVSVSSVFAGFNRGTLQSNSPHHHHFVDGTNLPFFFGASFPITAVEAAASENPYLGSFNGRLQVCCNEAHRNPRLKGEGK